MKFTKESAYRAGRTFVQSAVAYLMVNAALIDYPDTQSALRSVLIGLCISAISAGIAGVMNMSGGDVDAV